MKRNENEKTSFPFPMDPLDDWYLGLTGANKTIDFHGSAMEITHDWAARLKRDKDGVGCSQVMYSYPSGETGLVLPPVIYRHAPLTNFKGVSWLPAPEHPAGGHPPGSGVFIHYDNPGQSIAQGTGSSFVVQVIEPGANPAEEKSGMFFLDVNPVIYNLTRSLDQQVMGLMHEKTFVIVHGLDRCGTNHLLANLHYQDLCFSHSERVVPASMYMHDCFGIKAHDMSQPAECRNRVISKYFAASHLVWTNHSRRVAMHPELKESGNSRVILQLRHPYLTWMSSRREFDKNGLAEFDLSKEETIKRFTLMILLIGDYLEAGIPISVNFHENMLRDREQTIQQLLGFMGLDPTNIKHFDDYGDEHAAGYGNYAPTRHSRLEDQMVTLSENKGEADEMVRGIAAYLAQADSGTYTRNMANLFLMYLDVEKNFETAKVIEIYPQDHSGAAAHTAQHHGVNEPDI